MGNIKIGTCGYSSYEPPGKWKQKYDYRYDYSESELEQLAQKLTELAEQRRTVYCMFNNDNMFANAQTLMKRLGA